MLKCQQLLAFEHLWAGKILCSVELRMNFFYNRGACCLFVCLFAQCPETFLTFSDCLDSSGIKPNGTTWHPTIASIGQIDCITCSCYVSGQFDVFLMHACPHEMSVFAKSYLKVDISQRAFGAKMTLYRRRCDVITSHRR